MVKVGVLDLDSDDENDVKIENRVNDNDNDSDLIKYDIESKILNSESKCGDVFMASEEITSDYLNTEDEEEKNDNIILIRFIEGSKNFQVDCYKRSYLKRILEDDDKGMLPCRESYLDDNGNVIYLVRQVLTPSGNIENERSSFVLKFVDKFNEIFYRVDFFGGAYFYISKTDIMKMIYSDANIFYIDTTPKNIINYTLTASLDYVKNEDLYLTGLPFREGYGISANHCQERSNISVAKVSICNDIRCLGDVIKEQTILNHYRRLIYYLLDDNTSEFNKYFYSLTKDEINQLLVYKDPNFDNFDIFDFAISNLRFNIIRQLIGFYLPENSDLEKLNQRIIETIINKDLISNPQLAQKLFYYYVNSLLIRGIDINFLQNILDDLINKMIETNKIPDYVIGWVNGNLRSQEGIDSLEYLK